MANEGSLIAATRTRIENGVAAFFGQGTFLTPFIIKELQQIDWALLGSLQRNQTFPSTAEVLLCEALLEIRRSSTLQAVLLLGVACEIAITELISEICVNKGLSKTKTNEMLEHTFKKKLLEHTVDLGTRSPQTTVISGFPTKWADHVCTLYTLRNGAAHAGRLSVKNQGTTREAQPNDISTFLFSSEALIAWTNQERVLLGLLPHATVTMLHGGYPISAMITRRP